VGDIDNHANFEIATLGADRGGIGHMAAILEQRVTRAAGWSRRLSAFSAMLLIVGGLSHRYGLLQSYPFMSVLGVVLAIALAGLALAAYAFARLWTYADLGGWDLSMGAAIALLVLAPFAVSTYRAVVYPMLTDISTDLEDPPVLNAAARSRQLDMNPIVPLSPQQARLLAAAYPNITGRRYDLPFDRTVDAVNAVVKRQGWDVYPASPTGLDATETTIEALTHTLIFAFPVDVAVRVTDEGASSYVDMRSASRYGRHDFGDNAARIAAFLTELDTEVAGQAGTVPSE